jgi:hypothetical protein
VRRYFQVATETRMFDAEKFLTDAFGSPEKVKQLMRAYGLPEPKDATVYKWFRRGSVPSDWLPILLAVLEIDRGAPFSIAAYVKVDA